MKKLIFLLGIVLSVGNAIAQQAYNVRSPYDPATQKVAEEMQGEVMRFTMSDSHIYPGTEREIWVYVPQQYTSDEPACLLVCMDGILYDATTVMDNLIASGEMPVTIGVFVNPGVVHDEDGEVVRYNRCKEFDSTDDAFVEFLENEVLAEVEGPLYIGTYIPQESLHADDIPDGPSWLRCRFRQAMPPSPDSPAGHCRQKICCGCEGPPCIHCIR